MSLIKQCKSCLVEKPATTEFWQKHKLGKYGLRPDCKSCANAESRARHKANPERHAAQRKAWRAANPEHGKAWYAANREKSLASSKARYAADPERVKTQSKAWRKANPEKAKAQREAWAKANPERDAANRKAWHEANSEHKKANARAWREANPERNAANVKAWVKANPERHLANVRAWHAANPEHKKVSWHRRRARIAASTEHFTGADLRLQYRSQKGLCWHCGVALDGKYHADHLVPLVQGGSNAANNLVCACAKCNLSKGGKTVAEWRGRLL